MNTSWSVGDVLGRLEKQVAFHRSQEEVFAQQEAHCREQREHHAREAAEAEGNLAAFRESCGPALERAGAQLPEAPPDPGLALGRRPKLSRLVEAVVQGMGPTEPFGRSKVLEELARRFGDTLRRRPQPRHVSLILQRLADSHRLHQIRPGRPHWEALYVRQRPEAPVEPGP